MNTAVCKSPGDARPEAVTFTAMTLNLRFGRADDGPNGWKYRKKCLSPLLARYNPDFLALQEVNDFQLRFLRRILPDHAFIGQRRPAPPFWQNNILFYRRRWRCTLQQHFFLSPTPNVPSRFRASRWPRQCTLGLFRYRGRQLACVDTHLDFDADVQLASARLILSRLARLPSEAPVLLMGDFNADCHSPCYRLLTGTDEQGGGFENVFGGTCPGTHHGFTGRSEGRAIDWILYRGKLEVLEARVVRDRFEGRYPSDHFPVVAVLRLSG